MDAFPPLPPEIWDRTPPGAQERILAQAAARAQLRAEITQLNATVEELAQRLGRNSHNSSQPPSADPPPTPKRSRRDPSGRRPGGPPGHEGHTRALVPVEEVEVVIAVTPERCRGCQHWRAGEEAQPERHQVTEIPPIKPVVPAYPWHQLCCPSCGALCTGAYHVSKRTTRQVMADLFGLPRSVGTIVNLEQATVQAVAEPGAEAQASVPQQPTASLDATGWREGQPRAWLWTAVTAWVTVFVVRRSRGGKVAPELLGERCWGSRVTDRWRAYTWDPTWRRQGCWAHVRRHIAAMLDRGGQSQVMGEAVRGQARQMFQWWHRGRDGTLAPTTCARYMGPIRREVERLLEAGQTCGVPKPAGRCRELRKVRRALWTFVRHDGVEPTNHAAERAIRPGVLWRKGSFGTQRADGSRVVEAMMTVVATLKQPHRDALDYLTAACEATLRGEGAPSLLPTPAQLTQGMRPAA
jgi:transposase